MVTAHRHQIINVGEEEWYHRKMPDKTPLADALALEENYFQDLNNTLSEAVKNGNSSLRNVAASQGALKGGRRLLEELRHWSGSYAKLFEAAIEKRRLLGQRVPELLTEKRVQDLSDRLCVHAETLSQTMRDNLDRSGLESFNSLTPAIAMETGKLKDTVRLRLQALPIEARLGMNQTVQPGHTINISHSNVANLNLGHIVGDIEASIQTLAESGNNDLAIALQSFSEAIGNSQALAGDERKALLEHVSLLSSQSAAVEAERKPSLLKSSARFIREAVSTTSELVAVWTTVERAAKSLGLF